MLCKYCHTYIPDSRNDVCQLSLECQNCNELVHLKCLKSGGTPGKLSADIFFIYTCCDCNGTTTETFTRQKMSWTEIVMLVLYNLTARHYQASMGGYFHRDKQIKKFLRNHWSHIFPHMKTKRKTWVQMLHSTLRSNPQYFKQGNPPVWFKLANPNFLPNQPLIDRIDKTRKHKKLSVIENANDDSCTNYSSSSRDEDTTVNANFSELKESHFSIFSMQTDLQNNMYSRSYVKPSARLSEYLFAGEEEVLEPNGTKKDTDEEVDIEIVETESVNISTNENNVNDKLFKSTPVDEPQCFIKEEPLSETEDFSEISHAEKTTPHVDPQSVQRLNSSLLTKRETPFQLAWRSDIAIQSSQCLPMNLAEEAYELSVFNKRISELDHMSVGELRLHRKLKMRQTKRERNLRIFDIDQYTAPTGSKSVKKDLIGVSGDGVHKENKHCVLDRFVQNTSKIVMTKEPSLVNTSFWTRLMGHTSQQYTCYVSPFTQRLLKPYIRRDYETKPLWVKLLNEIHTKSKTKNGILSEQPYETGSIDYSYVRPHHIPAVNSLAEQYFWPGINLSECLQFPDFSCVALYKKLVIAFAFLVPDSEVNEAYISFIFTRPEWRKAGIACFMLYHLIQTCMGRDITLHVSATNPALMLYQKFGFKIEEFVQDFYDKYLPVSSNECRHALFLRLKR